MSRFTVLAVSGFLASALMASPSFADDGQDHLCHDANGAKANNLSACCYNPDRDGPTNIEAYPFCPGVLPDGSNFPSLDRTQTLHSHACQAGVNCGPPADLTNIKPFFDTAAVAAPPPPPAPVAALPPPPPLPATTVVSVPAAAAAPVYGAVPFSAAGLGNAGLIAAGVGAAAIAGIIAIAASDDDDDAAVTPSTPGT